MKHLSDAEFHLLQCLGRRRRHFDRALAQVIERDVEAGVGAIDWKDCSSEENPWLGMDFLPDSGGDLWRQFWPDPMGAPARRKSMVPTWGAAAQVIIGHGTEWLLVQPLGEATRRPAAPEAGKKSAEQMRAAFSETQAGLGLRGTKKQLAGQREFWIENCFSLGGQMAGLHFLLHRYGVKARLVFIDFHVDEPRAKNAPLDWPAALRIPARNRMSDRVHWLSWNLSNDLTRPTALFCQDLALPDAACATCYR